MDIFLQIVKNHAPAFLHGINVSVQLSLIVWGSGLLLGAFLGVLSAKFPTVVGIPARIFSFLLSGIPVLVYLFWAHYPLQAYFSVVINPFFHGCLGVQHN